MKILETALCPFCNHVLDIEMFNGTYGCESGCDYISFEVDCPGCGKEIYRTGDFGEFADGSEYHDEYGDDPEEYRRDFMADFAEAVQKINAERMA